MSQMSLTVESFISLPIKQRLALLPSLVALAYVDAELVDICKAVIGMTPNERKRFQHDYTQEDKLQ